MAGSTFLVLTNKLLRRLNEVQLTNTNFPQARNVQAMAQDAIIAAVAEINVRESQWPWNKNQGTALADVGTQEFTWPSDPVIPYWDSFRIQGVPADAIESATLTPLTQEEYFKYLRQIDLDSVPNDGLQIPKFVYPVVGGFGVTPMPNKPYTIKYEYYTIPTDMVAYDDLCAIPTPFDYVIINFALKHYYMYKDNIEQADKWESAANKSFADIRNYAVNRPDYMWSNMVNYGGMRWYTDYTKV